MYVLVEIHTFLSYNIVYGTFTKIKYTEWGHNYDGYFE